MHLPTEDASAVAAAGWRALGIDRRAAPLEAALEPTSVKADPAIDSLGDDVLSLCLAQARCGWTLAAAMQVCHAWRTVAAGEELWENAVTTRWRLATRRRSRSGKYVHGERSWREVWRVFHRRRRRPCCAALSPRAVHHALGESGRLAAWLLINHQPACRLLPPLDGCTSPRLSCKLLLQNLRPETLCLLGGGHMLLLLRDGRPLAVEQVGWCAAVPPAEPGAADASAEVGCGLISPPPLKYVLPPLHCMLMELRVHASGDMAFEPDLLEAAHALVVTLPPHGQVQCRFEGEEALWRHYEPINSSFYVHHENETV
mmetsp:Transcript_8993/g.28813  ORF Transcript_8993/g.28813 Transcript_8993/m.28813 type:complete len:315 (-) Transcript_8993:442-1386(-)